MMKYKLIVTTHQFDMESEVNKLLVEGWRLQGGTTVNDGDYVQAMVQSEPVAVDFDSIKDVLANLKEDDTWVCKPPARAGNQKPI